MAYEGVPPMLVGSAIFIPLAIAVVIAALQIGDLIGTVSPYGSLFRSSAPDGVRISNL